MSATATATSTCSVQIRCCSLRFLRATEQRGVPVLLLHGYPFHRQAAYLAQVYSHAFIDIGLAVHNTGALSRTLISGVVGAGAFRQAAVLH